MPLDRANVVIIGGGVVGCAIACELSAHTADVFLIEQLPRLGIATSTSHSGVIHSGIYYVPRSLHARPGLDGNGPTREFCVAHGVSHRDCGKIVVASHENEVATLERLAENGRVNGVENLRLIGPREIREREPHVTGVAALEVPSTSIVSAEELVKAYARVAAERGANILVDARVVALEPSSDFIVVSSEIGDQTHPAAHPAAHPARVLREAVEARCVVNSAGLYADEVAA